VVCLWAMLSGLELAGSSPPALALEWALALLGPGLVLELELELSEPASVVTSRERSNCHQRSPSPERRKKHGRTCSCSTRPWCCNQYQFQ